MCNVMPKGDREESWDFMQHRIFLAGLGNETKNFEDIVWEI